MRKALKMVLCSALLVAALFTFSAFTSAPTGMNPHTAHAASATTMSPSYTCPLPVLYQGGNNPSWAVKLAQQSLNWWSDNSNYHWSETYVFLAVDGIYGPQTKQDVKDFQQWYNATYHLQPYLTVDGIVGAKTWHALGHC
ncbi:peptidoglycan-binding domain-containing protein [Ktedonobacter racemifer]|uniref:Peptidoglycan-binding domain 1 protein n=1 Tax=Ktedonobacter racemifer DSM 44963 TaxID=485913 RepID=D6TNB2_KTERA|nr:peptidoglycan-binding domain-containing protein [Ktedonobacter racemifer]EFH85425.1 Peptidoglycan-binding domain 1 protein [Ktedonobacter racemifer DSM 44963]